MHGHGDMRGVAVKRDLLDQRAFFPCLDGEDDLAHGIQNQRYPLELFLKVITVSLRTLEIQDKLPRLNFATLS